MKGELLAPLREAGPFAFGSKPLDRGDEWLKTFEAVFVTRTK